MKNLTMQKYFAYRFKVITVIKSNNHYCVKFITNILKLLSDGNNDKLGFQKVPYNIISPKPVLLGFLILHSVVFYHNNTI